MQKGFLVAESLFYAVVVGCALGLLYDISRLLRLTFNDKFVFDFLFWIICAFTVFSYFLIFQNGSLRTINFIFILIGFLLYIFTLGYVTKSLEIKFSASIKRQMNKIKNLLKSLKKQLQSKWHIYYNKYVKTVSLFKKDVKVTEDGKEGKEE